MRPRVRIPTLRPYKGTNFSTNEAIHSGLSRLYLLQKPSELQWFHGFLLFIMCSAHKPVSAGKGNSECYRRLPLAKMHPPMLFKKVSPKSIAYLLKMHPPTQNVYFPIIKRNAGRYWPCVPFLFLVVLD